MMEKVKDILKKYRFAVLVALAGVVLMLLPAGKQDTEADDTAGEEMSFSLEETERRMAEVLSAMDGVGRVQVMLTLQSGEALSLAEDSSAVLGSGGDVRQDSQVLTVNRGSGRQEVVVTQRLYPTYQGAVVVCQGAGDSHPRRGTAVLRTRQPCAPAGAGDGVCADRAQQR